MPFFHRISSAAFLFTTRYLRSLVFITLLLWIPQFFLLDGDFHETSRQIIRGCCNILFCISTASLLCLISFFLSKINHYIEIIWLSSIHILTYTLFFVELFLAIFFDCHINANIFQLIDETNFQESSEFLTTYLLTFKFLGTCVVTGLIIVTEFFFKKITTLAKKRNDRKLFKQYSLTILSSILIISLTSFFWNIRYFSLEYREDWKKTETAFIRHAPIFYVFESISQFLQERNSFELCALSNENITIDAVDSVPKKIVLIIGESFNRHHSSLYGYSLKTNPKLESLENLFIFDNVISPINATSSAFQSFLSLASINENREWNEEPLFPAIFNAAGYNVIFYSNQFVKEANMSTHDASVGFFNHPLLASKLFDYRNTRKFNYDEDLLNDYKSKRDSIETDSLNLLIFHLYGQHMNPVMRFPSKRAHFNTHNYENRKELSLSQKQEVANYDNATLYNDSIVYEIIKMYENQNAAVIYFADHGDEANDYRPHIGRSRGLHLIGAPGLHCQLDIPFLIWLSNKWIENNPGDVKKIQTALHKPFIIDDIPHVLLELAKIKNKFYNPSKSIINESYNTARKRVIVPLASKPVDYDSICSRKGTEQWTIGF